jgi:hypothetical protein
VVLEDFFWLGPGGSPNLHGASSAGGEAAGRRRHSLKVEHDGHLKNFVIFFLFLLRCFVLFYVSLNVNILFAKKLEDIEDLNNVCIQS